MKSFAYIKIVSILLVLCLLMAGCGSKKQDPTQDGASQNAQADAKPGEVNADAPDVSSQGGDAPDGTSPVDGGQNGSSGSSGSTGEALTPQQIAAQMQDYTIGENGKAAPVSLVDDNYLILVNKTHPVSDDYWPDDLVTVSKTVAGVGNADTHKLRKVAADALEEMFAAAEKDGIDIALRTGFRSYSYQKSLFNSYAQNHGEAEANKYSARPGESEHQSGLCCDLGGKSEGYALSYSFGDTPEGRWVAEHAHEYGYIIRYIDGKTVNGEMQPGEITGYVFEPWHIRYVGPEVASEIVEKGITFEEYLGVLD